MKKAILCLSMFAVAVAVPFATRIACAERQRESLERYPSASLSVESISAVGCDGARTAWVRDPGNYVHLARVSGYIGDAYRKIVDITEREVRFVELHQSASGEWSEVPKSLRLRDGLSTTLPAESAGAEPEVSVCGR